MCKLFFSLFLFLEYKFLVESPTKVAIKTEFSKLFPIFFPKNNHILNKVSPAMGGFCRQLVFCRGAQKSPPTENQLLKKKNGPKNLFKSEKKRNFAT